MSSPLDLATTGLVLASAGLHASWNLLLKRTGADNVVVGLSKVVEVVAFAPFFLVFSLPGLPEWRTMVLLVSVAAVGVLMNYLALARAYRSGGGELSFVYPIARGFTLVLLPMFGALAFGERLTGSAMFGLLLIIAGILVLQLNEFSIDAIRVARHRLVSPATGYAMAAAAVNAFYTIWDKRSIGLMQPFAYMYSYTVLVALAYAWWLRARVGVAPAKATWSEHKWRIGAIGVLNMCSYLLILFALRNGTSSLVVGLRQLSIALGVILGWRILRERMSAPRAVAVVMVTAGCVVLAAVRA